MKTMTIVLSIPDDFDVTSENQETVRSMLLASLIGYKVPPRYKELAAKLLNLWEKDY